MRDEVLALLATGKDGTSMFPDAAIPKLLALVRPLEGDALMAAAVELLRLAHFLDVERKSPAASGTLVTLLQAIGPALFAVDAARAGAIVTQTEGAAAKLRSFQDDQRVVKVLDSGARPVGTVPAGPMARFQVAPKK